MNIFRAKHNKLGKNKRSKEGLNWSIENVIVVAPKLVEKAIW